MGMGERKTRAKQFKQKTDEVVAEEIKQANLFSGKLVESDLTYECVREPEDAAVEAGDSVLLIDLKDQIGVFKRMKPIGYVVTSQVDTLRANLRIPERKGRSMKAHVIEVSELTPTFIVQVRG
jgi:hypothetical protein